MSLPSRATASKAVHSVQLDCDVWRKVVLQAIEYATSGNAASTNTRSEGEDDDEKGTAADNRVNETALYLLNALKELNSNQESKISNGDQSTTPWSNNAARELAEDLIVDALWLMGTMLESPKEDADGNSKDKTESNQIDPYKMLCKLTNALVVHPQNESLTPIPYQKLLASLEPQHLHDSGILTKQSLDLFIKKIRKLNTDMFYRQKKVNLMQEESEGYAKFVRMLINLPLLNNSFDLSDKEKQEGRDFNRKHSQEKMAQTAKLGIIELIGTFDLDPNRCLDLTLDALEGEIRQLLQTNPSTKVYELLRNAKGHALTVHLLLQVIQIFPAENVSHLVGFKYAAYVYVEGVNAKQKETPKSLYLTTALLSAHGHLSLTALQPHLSPLSHIEKGYDDWKQAYQKKIKKMGVVSLNSSKSTADVEDKADSVQGIQKHQIIQLFLTMLDVGADWGLACEIFHSKKEEERGVDDEKNVKDIVVKCCCMYPLLGLKLCDIVKGAIAPLLSTVVDRIGSKMCLDGEEVSVVANVARDYSLLPFEWDVKQVITLSANLSLLDFCKRVEGIMEPIIMSGSVASNAVLYCNLCRLVHAMLSSYLPKEGSTTEVSIANVDEKVLEFIERVLVASLSLFPFNPAIASDLWSVLSLLPYHLRYALYAAWRKHGLEKAALRSMIEPRKSLAQIESEVTTGMSIKYLLKRMSKDNIKDMGRQVSKVAHNNPLVVFTLILNQIESYDNLILMMVETFKFMGVLSLDVMGYCLLVSLGGEGEGRNKLKDDGVNPAQWLSSLETFTGAFYKRFTDVELHGLLAYFTRRLHEGHTLELGVLSSLVKMAGGYGFVDSESTASLSTVQLEGRCGSLALRRETSDFGIVEKVNLRSSRRLRASLQDDSCGVVFMILLAQLRGKVLFEESRDSPKQIKLIGNLYDKCHRTLNILLHFLSDGSQDLKDVPQDDGAIAIYAKAMPKLGDLIKKFGIANADAWTLCRPLIRASIFAEEDKSGKDRSTTSGHLMSFHPTSSGMEKSYHTMLPQESWNHITHLLFSRFYSYAIYDLTCPDETYLIEIARVKREIDRLEILQKGGRDAIGMQASMASAVAAAGGTQRAIREATAFTKEHALDLDRFKCTEATLRSDMKRQKTHFEHVMKQLEAGKSDLLVDLTSDISDASSVFFTTCIYPRSLLSPEDAIYCARFIMLLHKMETPGFSTLQLIDVIVSAVAGALYSITENEAGCFGIFLNEVWNVVTGWRYDQDAYEIQVSGKPGGICNCVNGEAPVNSVSETMKHAEFVRLYNSWHASLGVVFIGYLQSAEYMHTRTALIILSTIVDCFPTKSTLGEKLLKVLAPLQEDSNHMQDIKAMAQGYSSKIIKARDTGTWKEEDKKATKAREEKEKKTQEERKKNAEKQLQEMAKDMEASAKQVGDSNHERKPHDRRDERRGQPVRFTPPPPTSSSVVDAGSQPRGETAPNRANDQRGSRDQKQNERGGRREEARATERGTGPSDRWERTGPDGGRGKRGRSPVGATDRGRGGDRDRDRGESKRVRRDASPSRRGPRRSSRR